MQNKHIEIDLEETEFECTMVMGIEQGNVVLYINDLDSGSIVKLTLKSNEPQELSHYDHLVLGAQTWLEHLSSLMRFYVDNHYGWSSIFLEDVEDLFQQNLTYSKKKVILENDRYLIEDLHTNKSGYHYY